ncbi:hypothetical protein OAE83_00945 [bacterium]|nr:hypothetical protein [bacterium]
MMICSVIGYDIDDTDPQEKALFSAEVDDVEQMEQLPMLLPMFACIPNIYTSVVTGVALHTERHEYHLPRDLVVYAIRSYERKLKQKAVGAGK